MEITEESRLSYRKESSAQLASSCTTPDSRLCSDISPGDEEPTETKTYPFALVLRLRVLQIVFGISIMVMGTVAFIEERGELNLGLGLPAGGITVLAAAVSIHMSRGFGGYRPSNCGPGGASLRFLGPSPLAVLWSITCTLHSAVVIQASRTLEHNTANHNLVILAAVHLTLALSTIFIVIVILRLNCRYDPD